jgi:hypothetical protein
VEDDEGHGGVTCVELDLAHEGTSSLKNFDLRSLTNLVKDTVEEGYGHAICGGGRACGVDEL